jgi:glycine cleavage system aminomethyltransferase T
VKGALLTAGEPLGLVHVGALAYPTSGVESGWIAAPVPAIYTSPDLAGYRKHLGLYSFEGQNPLYGSFFSDRIEDYYVSPYELGYGRSISFGHDFIGRDALLKAKDNVRRTKVTLVFDPADAALAIAPGQELALSNGRYRVESGGGLAGQAYHTASLAPASAVLSLAVIDRRYATPGTGVTVSWGEHPGHGTAPDADLGFPRIRATVAPAPYSEHARTSYRTAG